MGKNKRLAGIGAALVLLAILYDIFIKPIVLLNVENFATKRGWGSILADAPDAPLWRWGMKTAIEWLTVAYSGITSGYAMAFAVGCVAIAFADWIIWPFRRFAKIRRDRRDARASAQQRRELGEQSLALCNELREFARVYIVPTKAFEQEFISIHQADGNPARFAEMLAAHSRQLAERNASNTALFIERFSGPLRDLLDGYLRHGVMDENSVDYYKWAIRTGFRHYEIADAIAYIGKRLSNGQSFEEGVFDHVKFGH